MTESTPTKSPLGTAAQAEFCQVLLEHLRAGLPVAEGLASLARGARSARLRQTAGAMADDLGRGLSLAEAMAAAGQAFPPAFVALVELDEKAGSLTAAFEHQQVQCLRQDHVRAAARQAATLPLAGVWLAVGVFVLLGFTIVPRFAGIFTELGAEIPPPTQWVLDITYWVHHSWYQAIPLVAVCLVWLPLRLLAKGDFNGLVWGMLCLVPPFALYRRRTDTFVFLAAMGALLRRGMPLPQALGVARTTMVGGRARSDALVARQEAEGGAPLAEVLDHLRFLPEESRQVLSLADPEPGLAKAAEALADSYERQTEELRWFDQMFVELVLLAVPVIVVVILVAYALYMPLFGIRGSIR